MGSSKDRSSNGGTIMCGEGYDGRWYVFLVQVVELTRGRFVWVGVGLIVGPGPHRLPAGIPVGIPAGSLTHRSGSP